MALERGTFAGVNEDTFLRGWVIGHHVKEGSRKTNEFEVKFWQYDKPFDYGKKAFAGTECIVIFAGKISFVFTNEYGDEETATIDSADREWIVLPTGLAKTVVVDIAPAYGVTVRWPSSPHLLKVIEKPK